MLKKHCVQNKVYIIKKNQQIKKINKLVLKSKNKALKTFIFYNNDSIKEKCKQLIVVELFRVFTF